MAAPGLPMSMSPAAAAAAAAPRPAEAPAAAGPAAAAAAAARGLPPRTSSPSKRPEIVRAPTALPLLPFAPPPPPASPRHLAACPQPRTSSCQSSGLSHLPSSSEGLRLCVSPSLWMASWPHSCSRWLIGGWFAGGGVGGAGHGAEGAGGRAGLVCGGPAGLGYLVAPAWVWVLAAVQCLRSNPRVFCVRRVWVLAAVQCLRSNPRVFCVRRV